MGCVCARAISWVFGVPTSCLLCTHIDSKAGGICAGAKKTDNSQMRANSKEPSIVCYANRNCLIYKFTSKGRVCGDEWLGMRSYHNTAVTIKENENEEQHIYIVISRHKQPLLKSGSSRCDCGRHYVLVHSVCCVLCVCVCAWIRMRTNICVCAAIAYFWKSGQFHTYMLYAFAIERQHSVCMQLCSVVYSLNTYSQRFGWMHTMN